MACAVRIIPVQLHPLLHAQIATYSEGDEGTVSHVRSVDVRMRCISSLEELPLVKTGQDFFPPVSAPVTGGL